MTACERQMPILLVEDDDVDAEAMVRSLRAAGFEGQIVLARDGHDALEILRRENELRRRKRSFLVLLDLGLPRMGGHEFLDRLRADSSLDHNVVFVLTASMAEGDRSCSYRKNVAGYMVKSDTDPGFSTAMALIDMYRATLVPPA